MNVSDVALSDSSSGQLSSERSKASCDVLSDLLVLTEGQHVKRRGGINSRVVSHRFLEQLNAKKEKKKLDEQLKAERKMEREKRKLEKEEKKEKARERIEKKKLRQAQKKGSAMAPTLESGMSEVTLNDTEQSYMSQMWYFISE